MGIFPWKGRRIERSRTRTYRSQALPPSDPGRIRFVDMRARFPKETCTPSTSSLPYAHASRASVLALHPSAMDSFSSRPVDGWTVYGPEFVLSSDGPRPWDGIEGSGNAFADARNASQRAAGDRIARTTIESIDWDRLAMWASIGWILTVLLGWMAGAKAIESKCTACQAVAHELTSRMEKELPRNALDMRHRLDAKGQRYGPVIDYKTSELRALELLDGLCDTMHHYVLQKREKKPEGEESKSPRRWTKEHSAKVGMSKAEKKEHGRRLFNYCAGLVEEFEDDIADQIRKELTAEGVEVAICQTLAQDCPRSSTPPNVEL